MCLFYLYVFVNVIIILIKKEDYIRVNTLESDMDLNYTEYIESSDGVNMDYNEYKKNNIVKQSKILIDLK